MVDVENYIKQIYNKKHVFALWEPSQHINIGDIGIVEKRNFHPLDNLKNFNINYETQTDTFETEYLYESDGVIKLNSTAEAGVTNPLVTNKIGYLFEFEDKEAMLIHTVNAERQRIINNISIDKKIKELVKSGLWNKKWVFVNEVIACDYGVYLFSDKGACSINIIADKKIGNEKINVAAFDLKNKVNYGSFKGTKITINSPHTPFVRLLKYHKSFLNEGGLFETRLYKKRRGGEDTSPERITKEKIEEITLNEFLNS